MLAVQPPLAACRVDPASGHRRPSLGRPGAMGPAGPTAPGRWTQRKLGGGRWTQAAKPSQEEAGALGSNPTRAPAQTAAAGPEVAAPK
jgi:hypothetical protein